LLEVKEGVLNIFPLNRIENLLSGKMFKIKNMDIESYLKSIKSNNSASKQKYKRVCLSPLRYAGGKSKAVGIILENLPDLKEKKIVSPFFGGGSVEMVLSLHLGFEVIGYDELVKKEVTCNNCSAILRYVLVDVSTRMSRERDGSRDSYTFIVCPECDNEVLAKK